MAYVIKADIPEPDGDTFAFVAWKTMYGGRRIAVGDVLFLFASENAGGRGLVGRAVVTAAQPVPPTPGLKRQTPRVTVSARRTALARRSLGRAELRPFRGRGDGGPEDELDFKLYRQATDKIVRVSDEAAAFLDACF